MIDWIFNTKLGHFLFVFIFTTLCCIPIIPWIHRIADGSEVTTAHWIFYGIFNAGQSYYYAATSDNETWL